MQHDNSYFQIRAIYVGCDNAQTTTMLPILWESKRNERSLIPVNRIQSQKKKAATSAYHPMDRPCKIIFSTRFNTFLPAICLSYLIMKTA